MRALVLIALLVSCGKINVKTPDYTNDCPECTLDADQLPEEPQAEEIEPIENHAPMHGKSDETEVLQEAEELPPIEPKIPDGPLVLPPEEPQEEAEEIAEEEAQEEEEETEEVCVTTYFPGLTRQITKYISCTKDGKPTISTGFMKDGTDPLDEWVMHSRSVYQSVDRGIGFCLKSQYYVVIALDGTKTSYIDKEYNDNCAEI